LGKRENQNYTRWTEVHEMNGEKYSEKLQKNEDILKQLKQNQIG